MALEIGRIFFGVDADIRNAQRGLQQTAAALSSFGNAAGGAAGGARQMAAAFARAESASGSLSSSLRRVVETAAGVATGFVAVQVIGKAMDMAKAGTMGFNAQLEQSKMAWSNFLQGAENADAMLLKIQQFAAVTPFDFAGVEKGAQLLMAMGFAAKDTLPMLRDIGNVASGLGRGTEGIQRIVIALGQMKAKGRVLAEELMQLQETGINTNAVLNIMAQRMGTTVSALRDMQEAGTLNSEAFIEAFKVWAEGGQFGGMMEKQAVTFTGAMTTISDSIKMASGTAFKPLFDRISAVVVEMSKFVQSDQFQAWAVAVAGAVEAVLKGLGELASVLKGVLQPMADIAVTVGQAVFGAFQYMNPFSNGTVDAVVTGAGNIGAALEGIVAPAQATQDAAKAVEGVAGAVGGAAAQAGESVDGLKKRISDLNEQLSTAEAVLKPFEAALDAAKTAVEGVKDRVDAQEQALARAEKTLQPYRDVVQQAKDRVAALSDVLADQQAALEKATEALDHARTGVASYTEQIASMKQALEDTRNAVGDQEHALAQAEATLTQYQSAVQAWDVQLRDVNERIRDQEHAVSEAEKALAPYAAKVELAQNRLDAARDTFDAVKAHVEDLRSKLKDGEQALRDFVRAPFEEEAKFNQAIDSNKSAVQALQIQLKGMQDSGSVSQKKMLGVKRQLDKLQTAGDALELDKHNTIDKMRQELDATLDTAAKPPVLSFAEQIAQAKKLREKVVGVQTELNKPGGAEEQLSLAQQRVKLLGNELAAQQNVLKEQSKGVEVEKAKLAALKETADSLAYQKDLAERQLAAHERLLDPLKAQLAATKDQQREQEYQLTLLEREWAARQRTLDPMRAAIDATKQQLSDAQDQQKQAERSLAAQEKLLDPLRAQIAAVKEELAQAEAQERQAGRNLDAQKKLVAPLKEALDTAKEHLTTLKEQGKEQAKQLLNKPPANPLEGVEDFLKPEHEKLAKFQKEMAERVAAMQRTLAPVLDPLKTAVQGLVGVFERLAPQVRGAATAFVEWLQGPGKEFQPILQTLVQGLIMVIGAIAGFTAASVLLGPVIRPILGLLGMLTSPLGLIAGALVLLYTAWTHNWFGIQQVAAGVIAAVTGYLGQFEISLRMIQLYAGLALQALASGDFAGAFDHLGTVARFAGGVIVAALGDLLNWLGAQVPVILETLGKWGLALVDWIAPRIPGVLAALGGVLAAIGDWIGKTGLPLLGQAVAYLAPKLWEWIKSVVPVVGEKLKEWLDAIATWLEKTGLPLLSEAAKKVIPALWGWIVAATPVALEKIALLYTAIKDWIVNNGIKPISEAVAGKVVEFVPALKGHEGALAGITTKLGELALGVVAFMVVWPKLAPVFETVAKGIGPLGTVLGTAKDVLLGLPGPLKIAGVGIGLFAAAYATDFAGVKTATDTLVTAVQPQLDTLKEGLGKLGTKLGEAFADFKAGDTKKGIDDIVEGLKAFGSALGTVGGQVATWVVTQALPALVAELPKLLKGISDWATDPKTWDAIGGFFATWAPKAWAWLGGAVGTVGTEAQKLLDAIGKWVQDPKTQAAFATVWNEWVPAALGWIGGAVTGLADEGKKLLTAIGKWFDDHKEDIATALDKWTDSFATWVGIAAKAVTDNLGSVIAAVTTWIDSTLFPELERGLGGLENRLRNSTNPAVQEFYDKLTDENTFTKANKSLTDLQGSVDDAKEAYRLLKEQIGGANLNLSGFADTIDLKKAAIDILFRMIAGNVTDIETVTGGLKTFTGSVKTLIEQGIQISQDFAPIMDTIKRAWDTPLKAVIAVGSPLSLFIGTIQGLVDVIERLSKLQLPSWLTSLFGGGGAAVPTVIPGAGPSGLSPSLGAPFAGGAGPALTPPGGPLIGPVLPGQGFAAPTFGPGTTPGAGTVPLGFVGDVNAGLLLLRSKWEGIQFASNELKNLAGTSRYASAQESLQRSIDDARRFEDILMGRTTAADRDSVKAAINNLEYENALKAIGQWQPRYLAKGGIVTRPTAAIVGESGPEAVLPLGSLRDEFTRVVLAIEASAKSQIDALTQTFTKIGQVLEGEILPALRANTVQIVAALQAGGTGQLLAAIQAMAVQVVGAIQTTATNQAAVLNQVGGAVVQGGAQAITGAQMVVAAVQALSQTIQGGWSQVLAAVQADTQQTVAGLDRIVTALGRVPTTIVAPPPAAVVPSPPPAATVAPRPIGGGVIAAPPVPPPPAIAPRPIGGGVIAAPPVPPPPVGITAPAAPAPSPVVLPEPPAVPPAVEVALRELMRYYEDAFVGAKALDAALRGGGPSVDVASYRGLLSTYLRRIRQQEDSMLVGLPAAQRVATTLRIQGIESRYATAMQSLEGVNAAEWATRRFAAGGVVTKATLGVFGEAGPEAVLPLAHLSDLLNQAIRPLVDTVLLVRAGQETRLDALIALEAGTQVRLDRLAELQTGGAGARPSGDVYVTVQVEGSVMTERDLAERVRDEIIKIQRRNGNAFAGVG